jgi:hypothetical protein
LSFVSVVLRRGAKDVRSVADELPVIGQRIGAYDSRCLDLGGTRPDMMLSLETCARLSLCHSSFRASILCQDELSLLVKQKQLFLNPQIRPSFSFSCPSFQIAVDGPLVSVQCSCSYGFLVSRSLGTLCKRDERGERWLARPRSAKCINTSFPLPVSQGRTD